MTPDALRLEQAMGRSAPLARLQHLLRESEARLDTVKAILPEALAPHLRAGPLDDNGWTLLVANAAVGAKLRHLLPRMETALMSRGLQVTSIRIRVQTV